MVELTDYGSRDIKQLQKDVKKAWPNVTFRGKDFTKGRESYYDLLDREADEPFYKPDIMDHQECYTGRLAGHDSDRFLSGFNT